MHNPVPPPPKVPPPGTLTEEEEDALPPGQMVDMTRQLLERTLGFKVVNYPGNYFECFTHKSVAVYYHRASYERLEFLGDSVVNFVTAKYLFDTYPSEDEGFMTKLRTRLTRSDTLAHLARVLQLDRFVFMSGKGLYRKWNTNKRILEDVFEALIGAIYLDQGLVVAKNFFIGVIHKYIDMSEMHKDRNYKDILMRYQHARSQPLPEYISKEIVVHEEDKVRKHFHVSVTIDQCIGTGTHRTKKGAEQEAARAVLMSLGVPLDD